MTMHASTFEYLKPTDAQLATMAVVRSATAQYADILELHVPNGPDKTYLLRQLREVAMWANVAITRNPDGTPRA
jgi:tryptophanyl-tRNA synthetase